MQPDIHSRVDTAVPNPDATAKLDEGEKRALELQAEAEHEQGPRMTEVVDRAREETGIHESRG